MLGNINWRYKNKIIIHRKLELKKIIKIVNRWFINIYKIKIKLLKRRINESLGI